MSNPKVSVCVPIHDSLNTEFFVHRLKQSLERQTYQNYELIITKEGKMAENTNAAIRKATGEIVKILYMDDYLANTTSLETMVRGFYGEWQVCGCIHDYGDYCGNYHAPTWNDSILRGENGIGSPSVLAFKNTGDIFFDENLSWLLDCDLYWRLKEKYGSPVYLNTPEVVIGIGGHQTTYSLPDQVKAWEHDYLKQKYGLPN